MRTEEGTIQTYLYPLAPRSKLPWRSSMQESFLRLAELLGGAEKAIWSCFLYLVVKVNYPILKFSQTIFTVDY